MPVAHPEPTESFPWTCHVGFPWLPRARQPLPASWGPWLMSCSPETAAAFWWPGPAPSLSPFPLLCSPISFIHNPWERGQGRGERGSLQAVAGAGARAPLTAEASLTHPATHVPLYGQGFLSVLKGNCEKSRADSGCLVVSWQQAWQEVFLSPPPPPFSPPPPPLFLFPPVSCVVYH